MADDAFFIALFSLSLSTTGSCYGNENYLAGKFIFNFILENIFPSHLRNCHHRRRRRSVDFFYKLNMQIVGGRQGLTVA